MPPGGNVTCTITNTAIAPKLTLVKTVDNGTTGATTPATAWTLTATGPTPISGTTGSPAVTAAQVQVGTYTLTETGPPGYTASAWDLRRRPRSTDPPSPSPRATTPPARSPTPRSSASLTLVKVVDNGTTGAAVTPADWSLRADGPTGFAGREHPRGDGDPGRIGNYTLSEERARRLHRVAWDCGGNVVVDRRRHRRARTRT